jgi:hypothetical protein
MTDERPAPSGSGRWLGVVTALDKSMTKRVTDAEKRTQRLVGCVQGQQLFRSSPIAQAIWRKEGPFVKAVANDRGHGAS